MAQLAGVPLVPLAYAARRAWVLGTWDRFVIPKPFTRIVVAAGEPVDVPRDLDDAGLEATARRMEAALGAAFALARARVSMRPPRRTRTT